MQPPGRTQESEGSGIVFTDKEKISLLEMRAADYGSKDLYCTCSGYLGHPFKKNLFDNDDDTVQAPFLRADV